jgi:hypothetical protein
MLRFTGLLWGSSLGLLVAPGVANAAQVCGTVADFNAYMTDNAAVTNDVTLTFDVTGVNPADFFNTKGCLAQFRNTQCNGGASDVGIKVYGTSEPLNTAHPPGTLKMEYGNQCCTLPSCGENWADPNPSAVIFQNGSEQCQVTAWVRPDSIGYQLVCGGVTYDAVGGNPETNLVNEITLLDYLLPGGGNTWEITNGTATKDQVCWEASGTPAQSLDVPVTEDVTVAPSTPTTVYADPTDLAVEAGDNQAYLKFVVPPIDGKVTKAVLFMHTRPESYSNGAGGEVHAVSSNAWSEGTLTFSTKPEASPTSLGRIGPAEVDQTVSLELTGAIAGPGTYSFAVISPATDTNGTHFYSKEGSATQGAYLRLSYETVDADGDGTPDGPDCNDASAAVHPGATEACNAVDDDCDGQIDDGCPGVGTGGSGGSGGNGGWSGSGAVSGGGDEADRGGTQEDSSGCAVGGDRDSDRHWLVFVALALLGFGRRSRRVTS